MKTDRSGDRAPRWRKMNFGRFDVAVFSSFFTYASGSVVLPVVLVAVAQELGFSLDEGGMSAGGALSIGRTTGIVAAMLLCGFIAGRWGKRRSFGVSVLMVGAGLGLCAAAPVYGVLFLALTLTGVGEGIIEGLATPFVRDLHPDESGRYINFTHAFWPIGIFCTVLAAGAMLSAGMSWRLVMAAIALLSLLPAGLLLLPTRAGHEYPEHPEPLHWTTVRNQMLAIVRVRRFWLFYAAMAVAGGGEFCLTFWTASYIQLNFGASAWAGGAGLACLAAGMAIARTGWGYWIRQHQLRTLVIVSALAGIPLTLAIPLLSGVTALFGMLFLTGLAIAPYWPSIQSYSADRLPGADTTMLFILLSCAGIPGSGLSVWLMGYIADRTGSLTVAFYLVPVSFAIMAGLIGLDAYTHRAENRRQHGHAGP